MLEVGMKRLGLDARRQALPSRCWRFSNRDDTTSQSAPANDMQAPEAKAAPSSESRPPKRTPSEELSRIKAAKRLREKRRKKGRKQEAQQLLAASKAAA